MCDAMYAIYLNSRAEKLKKDLLRTYGQGHRFNGHSRFSGHKLNCI